MALGVFSFISNIWYKIVRFCYTFVGAIGNSWKDEGEKQQEEEKIKQVTHRRVEKNEDTVDTGIEDNFRKALERVSEAIYTLCISPWHNPPEEMKDQLLFKELNNAIQNIYVKAQKKTHHIEGYAIIIATVNILTDHLKSFRKKRRNYREMMRKEELDIIRHHTKALLCCFLPDSFSESKHITVFLNEIVAVNVLEPAISTMADPNFINQQIITFLEADVNWTHNQKNETSDIPDCQQLQYIPQKGIKKTKLNKVKGVLKRLFKKPHSFGNDTCGMYRAWNIAEDSGTSEIGIDTIDYPVGIEKSDNLCSKWKEENWIARVSMVNISIYCISVLKRDDMQTEVWNVKRSIEDFIRVHSILSMNHPNEVPASFISAESWKSNKQFISDFVDKLVELTKEYNDSEAAFFLSPFNYTEEEEKQLFHDIFIDQVATEEELQDSPLDSSSTESLDCDSSETDCCHFKILSLRKRKKDKKSSCKDSDENNEVSECNSEDMLAYIKEASKSTGPVNRQSYSLSQPGQQDNAVRLARYSHIKQVTAGNLAAERKKSLQKELINSLCRLADEMLAGGHNIFTFLNSCGALKTLEETVCQCEIWLLAEEQIVGYLDKLSDMMKSSEDAPQLQKQPADILHNQALEQIMKALMSFTSDKRIYRFLVQRCEKYIQMSLDAFQDPIANKYALFRLLKELTGYITGGLQEPAEIHKQKSA
ncbi:hypothetical protein XENTR_v10020994 [Xenopus tropicalis]|uniref:Uncharacterized protein LOC100492077 isoform X1 n=1 Tax=Xenopus tropicalis TaxID=8364 RepID=A0A8J0SWI6_XENTR|nr:uncharacterized protein LOC100492077 isoform X1 [Xenopus tropicalis]KAE8584505.1 hypothetical protein XENTR_v10020994 [Xenopus tropicalis]